MREEADQPEITQVDREHIIKQPRQDQDQNPEQQRDQRLDHDDIDMHGRLPASMVCGGERATPVPGRIKSSTCWARLWKFPRLRGFSPRVTARPCVWVPCSGQSRKPAARFWWP